MTPPLVLMDPDAGARGADADHMAAVAAALGLPDVGVPVRPASRKVEAEAVDPDLDRGRAGQVDVGQGRSRAAGPPGLGGRVAESDGQAGHARLDLDPGAG